MMYLSLRLNVNKEMNLYVPEAFYSFKVILYAKQEYMTKVKNNNKTWDFFGAPRG